MAILQSYSNSIVQQKRHVFTISGSDTYSRDSIRVDINGSYTEKGTYNGKASYFKPNERWDQPSLWLVYQSNGHWGMMTEEYKTLGLDPQDNNPPFEQRLQVFLVSKTAGLEKPSHETAGWRIKYVADWRVYHLDRDGWTLGWRDNSDPITVTDIRNSSNEIVGGANDWQRLPRNITSISEALFGPHRPPPATDTYGENDVGPMVENVIFGEVALDVTQLGFLQDGDTVWLSGWYSGDGRSSAYIAHRTNPGDGTVTQHNRFYLGDSHRDSTMSLHGEEQQSLFAFPYITQNGVLTKIELVTYKHIALPFDRDHDAEPSKAQPVYLYTSKSDFMANLRPITVSRDGVGNSPNVENRRNIYNDMLTDLTIDSSNQTTVTLNATVDSIVGAYNWTVKAPVGEKIRMDFLQFQEMSPKVRVYNGHQVQEDQLIQEVREPSDHTGEYTFREVVSLSNKMYVHFDSADSEEGPVQVGRLSAICSLVSASGGEEATTLVELSKPTSKWTIRNGESGPTTKWLLRSRTGSLVLRIFSFDFGAGDELRVYKGNTTDDALVHTFSDTNEPTQDVVVTGGAMLLCFSSASFGLWAVVSSAEFTGNQHNLIPQSQMQYGYGFLHVTDHKTDYTCLIRAPKNRVIEMIPGRLECSNGRIAVYDGKYSTAPQLAAWDASLDIKYTENHAKLQSSGRYMYVSIKKDLGASSANKISLIYKCKNSAGARLPKVRDFNFEGSSYVDPEIDYPFEVDQDVNVQHQQHWLLKSNRGVALRFPGKFEFRLGIGQKLQFFNSTNTNDSWLLTYTDTNLPKVGDLVDSGEVGGELLVCLVGGVNTRTVVAQPGGRNASSFNSTATTWTEMNGTPLPVSGMIRADVTQSTICIHNPELDLSCHLYSTPIDYQESIIVSGDDSSISYATLIYGTYHAHGTHNSEISYWNKDNGQWLVKGSAGFWSIQNTDNKESNNLTSYAYATPVGFPTESSTWKTWSDNDGWLTKDIAITDNAPPGEIKSFVGTLHPGDGKCFTRPDFAADHWSRSNDFSVGHGILTLRLYTHWSSEDTPPPVPPSTGWQGIYWDKQAEEAEVVRVDAPIQEAQITGMLYGRYKLPRIIEVASIGPSELSLFGRYDSEEYGVMAAGTSDHKRQWVITNISGSDFEIQFLDFQLAHGLIKMFFDDWANPQKLAYQWQGTESFPRVNIKPSQPQPVIYVQFFSDNKNKDIGRYEQIAHILSLTNEDAEEFVDLQNELRRSEPSSFAARIIGPRSNEPQDGVSFRDDVSMDEFVRTTKMILWPFYHHPGLLKMMGADGIPAEDLAAHIAQESVGAAELREAGLVAPNLVAPAQGYTTVSSWGSSLAAYRIVAPEVGQTLEFKVSRLDCEPGEIILSNFLPHERAISMTGNIRPDDQALSASTWFEDRNATLQSSGRYVYLFAANHGNRSDFGFSIMVRVQGSAGNPFPRIVFAESGVRGNLFIVPIPISIDQMAPQNGNKKHWILHAPKNHNLKLQLQKCELPSDYKLRVSTNPETMFMYVRTGTQTPGEKFDSLGTRIHVILEHDASVPNTGEKPELNIAYKAIRHTEDQHGHTGWVTTVLNNADGQFNTYNAEVAADQYAAQLAELEQAVAAAKAARKAQQKADAAARRAQEQEDAEAAAAAAAAAEAAAAQAAAEAAEQAEIEAMGATMADTSIVHSSPAHPGLMGLYPQTHTSEMATKLGVPASFGTESWDVNPHLDAITADGKVSHSRTAMWCPMDFSNSREVVWRYTTGSDLKIQASEDEHSVTVTVLESDGSDSPEIVNLTMQEAPFVFPTVLTMPDGVRVFAQAAWRNDGDKLDAVVITKDLDLQQGDTNGGGFEKYARVEQTIEEAKVAQSAKEEAEEKMNAALSILSADQLHIVDSDSGSISRLALVTGGGVPAHWKRVTDPQLGAIMSRAGL